MMKIISKGSGRTQELRTFRKSAGRHLYYHQWSFFNQ